MPLLDFFHAQQKVSLLFRLTTRRAAVIASDIYRAMLCTSRTRLSRTLAPLLCQNGKSYRRWM